MIQEPQRPELKIVYEGIFNPKIDKIFAYVLPLLFGIINFLILFSLPR